MGSFTPLSSATVCILLVFSEVPYITQNGVVFIDATQWEPWTTWSSCRHRDGTVATCWKSNTDPPQRKRHKLCTKEKSGEQGVCVTDKRECTNLHSCPFGEKIIKYIV